jgi:hypothetical protein
MLAIIMRFVNNDKSESQIAVFDFRLGFHDGEEFVSQRC